MLLGVTINPVVPLSEHSVVTHTAAPPYHLMCILFFSTSIYKRVRPGQHHYTHEEGV